MLHQQLPSANCNESELVAWRLCDSASRFHYVEGGRPLAAESRARKEFHVAGGRKQ
jgi:hypothetical protein